MHFMSYLLNQNAVNLYSYVNMCRSVDMDFDMLYKMYIGKNTLNIFRQDHGYKDGTYNKVWGGIEDNEQLSNILDSCGDHELNFGFIYGALELSYNTYL